MSRSRAFPALVPQLHRPPPLNIPPCWPTAGADGPERRPTPRRSVGQLRQGPPTGDRRLQIMPCGFRHAKIQWANGVAQQENLHEYNKTLNPRARAGNSGPVFAQPAYANGGLLIGCECAGKNRLMRSRGFRGISSTGKEPPVCGIPRPLDRAGVFPPFLSPTQTLIPLVYDAPAKKWFRCPPFRRCGRFAAV